MQKETKDQAIEHNDMIDSEQEWMDGEISEEEILYDVAELFKVFADSTRVRILFALFEKEMCVYDITEQLGMSQSAISHQLRVLKQARLVRYRRAGKSVIYALADDHIKTILNQGLEHVLE